VYHHNIVTQNYISFFSEIALELFCGCLALFVADAWIVLFYTIIYVLIHYVNYGMKVNINHELHHKDVTTNFGLDIYDVMFHTKNKNSGDEDIHHFIPNILLSFGIVAWIQQNYNPTWMHIGYVAVVGIISSHIIFSLYLWRRYDPISKTFIGI